MYDWPYIALHIFFWMLVVFSLMATPRYINELDGLDGLWGLIWGTVSTYAILAGAIALASFGFPIYGSVAVFLFIIIQTTTNITRKDS